MLKLLKSGMWAVLLLAVASGCGKKEEAKANSHSDALLRAPGNISLHSSLGSAERELMRGDLETLQGLWLPTIHAQLMERLGVDSQPFKGEDLLNWLAVRFRYVVGSSFIEKEDRITLEGSLPSVTPQVALLNFSTFPIAEGQTKSSRTIMRNLGAFLYSYAKRESQSILVNLDEKKVRVNSPRIGLIEANAVFTSSMYTIPGVAKESLGLRMARLSVYFHEARHSDGNGSTLSFVHTICPEGHDYEGINQCDEADNGPFGIETAILHSFYKNCESCETSEKELMALIWKDARNRILTKNPVNLDARPERLAGVAE